MQPVEKGRHTALVTNWKIPIGRVQLIGTSRGVAVRTSRGVAKRRRRVANTKRRVAEASKGVAKSRR
jgi:hypothetical protein